MKSTLKNSLFIITLILMINFTFADLDFTIIEANVSLLEENPESLIYPQPGSMIETYTFEVSEMTLTQKVVLWLVIILYIGLLIFIIYLLVGNENVLENWKTRKKREEAENLEVV